MPLPAVVKPSAAEPCLAMPEVRVVDPFGQPEWDEWVSGCAGASVFHRAAWAAVLAETYGFTPCYLVATLRDGWRALLPLMETRSWLTARRGVSLPFTDYLPVLPARAETFRALFDSALAFGRARGWRSLECHGGAEWLAGVPASLCYYRHVLALEGSVASLFAGCAPSVRRAIRKAQQSGLVVCAGESAELVAAYYALHCLTRRRHGLPPQPFSFFASIQRRLIGRGAGRVFLVRSGGRPVAGAVFLHSGPQAAYKFGASEEAYQPLRPNNLLMWEAIKWYHAQGMASLDFGRTSLAHDGLRRFKLGWGATETRTGYVKFDLARGVFRTETDRVSGWHTAVFRRMPVSVLQWVGRVLYRHLT